MNTQDEVDEVMTWLKGMVPATTPFLLRQRDDSASGRAGNVVADGVIFPAAGQGKCVVNRRGDVPGTTVRDTFTQVLDIECHDDRTVMEIIPVTALINAVLGVLNMPAVTAGPHEVGGVSDPNTLMVLRAGNTGVEAGWVEAIESVREVILDHLIDEKNDDDDDEGEVDDHDSHDAGP